MGASQLTWPPQLMQAVPFALATFDSTGKLLNLNSSGERLLAVRGHTVLGQPLDQLRPVLSPEVADALTRVVAHKSQCEQGTARISGRQVRYTAGRGQDGVEDVAYVILDEVERRADESREFLAMASHEFKTPLTAIKGGTQLLKRRLQRASGLPGEREIQLLAMVSDQVDKLASMVDSLLETSRLSSGKIAVAHEPHDLREVIEVAVRDFREAACGRDIRLAIPQYPIRVLCDPRRIVQAVRAILQNSVEYSEPERPITVTVRTDSSDAYVDVSDEGMGIAPEDQPHVFERFYRGRDVDQGLGVGLYIAAELIRLHDGRIWVTSQPDAGTTVHLALPLAERGPRAEV